MKQAEMFDGADLGVPRPSLAKARDLVAEIEAHLEDEDQFDYLARSERLAQRAKHLGAYSVARVLLWASHPAFFDKYGFETVDIEVERVAVRWLRRQELKR